MGFYGKLERKFGKYAIKNLTLVLAICYAVGYFIRMIEPSVIYYITLDPVKILHGQVWRIISWLLIPPPESNIFFAIIMIIFCYSIGTTLEKVWGAFHFNMYVFSGIIFTILGSFLMLGYAHLKFGDAMYADVFTSAFSMFCNIYSTYYINMSLFLAFACTFPEHEVLFMFFIPVKVKWVGIIDGVYILYEMINGMVKYRESFGFVYLFAIGSAMLNFLIFFITTRRYIIRTKRPTKSQRNFRTQMRDFEYKKQSMEQDKHPKISKHKCAICGRTERDGDDLTFRFCSKCDGNYEYCQDHLYTHIHFTNGEE